MAEVDSTKINLFAKVTHVVVAKSEVKKHMKKLQEAKKMSLPTLNGDYLKQIIKTDLGGNDTDATDFEVVRIITLHIAHIN